MGFDRKYLVWALVYVSFIYADIHKLWLGDTACRLARLQRYAHQVGALMMFTALFPLYGGIVPADQIESSLAPSTIIVFIAALLMMVMVLKTPVTAATRLAPNQGAKKSSVNS